MRNRAPAEVMRHVALGDRGYVVTRIDRTTVPAQCGVARYPARPLDDPEVGTLIMRGGVWGVLDWNLRDSANKDRVRRVAAKARLAVRPKMEAK